MRSEGGGGSERGGEKGGGRKCLFPHTHLTPPSVGRVTGRLPQELADEVVQSLLEFFT